MITFKQKLTAIKDSVDDWDNEVNGELRGGCPLCKLYAYGDNRCSGCPISEKTGKRSCKGTPYYEYKLALGLSASHPKDPYAEYITNSAARKFRDWLKDLYIEVSEAGASEKPAKPQEIVDPTTGESVDWKIIGKVNFTGLLQDRIEKHAKAIGKILAVQYDMQREIDWNALKIKEAGETKDSKEELNEVTMFGRPVVNVRTGKRVKREDLEDKVWYMDLKTNKKRRKK